MNAQLKEIIMPLRQLAYLPSPQDMIPHRSAPKVDVEICVASSDGHEAILLDLWVHHVFKDIGGFCLCFLQVSGPNSLDPVNLTYLKHIASLAFYREVTWLFHK